MMDVDEMFTIEEELEVDPSESTRRIEKKKEKKRKWRRRKREKLRENGERVAIFNEEVKNIDSNERNDLDNKAKQCSTTESDMELFKSSMSAVTGFNFLQGDGGIDETRENNIQSDANIESDERNDLDNEDCTVEMKAKDCSSSDMELFELNMSVDTAMNMLQDDGNLHRHPRENNVQCCRDDLDNESLTMKIKTESSTTDMGLFESNMSTYTGFDLLRDDNGLDVSLDTQSRGNNIHSELRKDLDNERLRDKIQENQSYSLVLDVKANECSNMELFGTDIRIDNANSTVSTEDIVQSNNMENNLDIQRVYNDVQGRDLDNMRDENQDIDDNLKRESRECLRRNVDLSESDIKMDLENSGASEDIHHVPQSNDSVEENLYIDDIDPELALEEQSSYSDEINNFDSGSDNREFGELASLGEDNIDDHCKQIDGLNMDSIDVNTVVCERNKEVEHLNKEITICGIMEEVKRTESELEEAVTLLISDKNTRKYMYKPNSTLQGNVLELDEESQDSVISERTGDRESLFVQTVTLYHKITYGMEETLGGTEQGCEETGSSLSTAGDGDEGDEGDQLDGGYGGEYDNGGDIPGHGKSTDGAGSSYDGDNQLDGGYGIDGSVIDDDIPGHGKSTDDGGSHDGDNQLDGGYGNDGSEYVGNDDGDIPGHGKSTDDDGGGSGRDSDGNEFDNGNFSNIGNDNGDGEDRSNDNDGNGAKVINEEEVIDKVINEEKVLINDEEEIDEGKIINEEEIIDEVINKEEVINEGEVFDKEKVIDEGEEIKEKIDEGDKLNDMKEKQSVARDEKAREISVNSTDVHECGDIMEITEEDRNIEEKEEGELSSSSDEEHGENITDSKEFSKTISKSNSIQKPSSTSNPAKDKSKESKCKDLRHKAQLEEVSGVKSHGKKSNIGFKSSGKDGTTSKKAERVAKGKELSRRRHSISCTRESSKETNKKTDKSAEKSGQKLVKERRGSLAERGESGDSRSSKKVGTKKATESRKISLSKERKSEKNNTKTGEKRQSSVTNQTLNTSSSTKDTRSKETITKSKSSTARLGKGADEETTKSSLKKVRHTANDSKLTETKKKTETPDVSFEKQRKQKSQGSDDKYSDKESTKKNSSKHTASDSRLKQTERETKASDVKQRKQTQMARTDDQMGKAAQTRPKVPGNILETKSSKIVATSSCRMKSKRGSSSSESSTKYLSKSNKESDDKGSQVDKIRPKESGNLVRSLSSTKSSKVRNTSNSAMISKRDSSSQSSTKYPYKSDRESEDKRCKVTKSSGSFVKSKQGDSSGSESVRKHSLNSEKELMKPNKTQDTRKEKVVTPIRKVPEDRSKGNSGRLVSEKSSACKNVRRNSDAPVKTASKNVLDPDSRKEKVVTPTRKVPEDRSKGNSGRLVSEKSSTCKKRNSDAPVKTESKHVSDKKSQEDSKKTKTKYKTDPTKTKPEKKLQDSGSKSRDKSSVKQEGKVSTKNDAQNNYKKGDKLEALKKEQSLSKNAHNKCKDERKPESSTKISTKERRFSIEEKPREMKRQSDKTVVGKTRKSIDGTDKDDKERRDNKINKDKTLESNKRKFSLEKDLEVKEKATCKNDENTSKETVLKKRDNNKGNDEGNVESLKKNSAKERSFSSDEKPREEKKLECSKSENYTTSATQKRIKVTTSKADEESRNNKTTRNLKSNGENFSNPSEGSQNNNNPLKQKDDDVETLNSAQSSTAEKVKTKTVRGKGAVGKRKLTVAEYNHRNRLGSKKRLDGKEKETCKPAKSKSDESTERKTLKQSEKISHGQSKQKYKGVRLSGKRKREDTAVQVRKVRKTTDTNKESVKTREAKLPGNVITARILKVDKRRGKALVLKRRHVNQLFIRGDNIVMVAYENVG